jgi:hypothetical protein
MKRKLPFLITLLVTLVWRSREKILPLKDCRNDSENPIILYQMLHLSAAAHSNPIKTQINC